MSTDKYLDKVYKPKVYTCYHFVADVLKSEADLDMSEILAQLFNSGKLSREHVRRFREITKPRHLCVVVMQRLNVNPPHMGIFFNGKVLHLHHRGVEYQPLDIATRGFTSVRFATCC